MVNWHFCDNATGFTLLSQMQMKEGHSAAVVSPLVSQQKGAPVAEALLCEVCTFYSCLCGFSPGPPASSHCPKIMRRECEGECGGCLVLWINSAMSWCTLHSSQLIPVFEIYSIMIIILETCILTLTDPDLYIPNRRPNKMFFFWF